MKRTDEEVERVRAEMKNKRRVQMRNLLKRAKWKRYKKLWVKRKRSEATPFVAEGYLYRSGAVEMTSVRLGKHARNKKPRQ